MSLYSVQKFVFTLNRDRELQARFREDRAAVLASWTLTDEERAALHEANIGLLYVLGVNGQLLMHFAAFEGMPWAEYLQAMRDGVTRYGPVRAGVYAMTTEVHEKVAGV
jgi:hypothetical protein